MYIIMYIYKSECIHRTPTSEYIQHYLLIQDIDQEFILNFNNLESI